MMTSAGQSPAPVSAEGGHLRQGCGLPFGGPADAGAARSGDSEAALEAYRQQRVLRTARVQLMSRAIGNHVYHPASAHAALRNQVMPAKTNAEWYETLAWIYGGTGLGRRGAAEAVAA